MLTVHTPDRHLHTLPLIRGDIVTTMDSRSSIRAFIYSYGIPPDGELLLGVVESRHTHH